MFLVGVGTALVALGVFFSGLLAALFGISLGTSR